MPQIGETYKSLLDKQSIITFKIVNNINNIYTVQLIEVSSDNNYKVGDIIEIDYEEMDKNIKNYKLLNDTELMLLNKSLEGALLVKKGDWVRRTKPHAIFHSQILQVLEILEESSELLVRFVPDVSHDITFYQQMAKFTRVGLYRDVIPMENYTKELVFIWGYEKLSKLEIALLNLKGEN